MRGSSLLGRAASLAIVAAAAAFLYATISRNWSELTRFEWSVDPVLFGASLLLHVGVLGWGVYIWSRVLACLDAPVVGYGPLLRIWSASNLTKYIPGAVWQFMTAAHLSRGRGLPAVVALTSMLLHVGFSLLAALAVSAVMLPIDPAFGPLGLVWVRVAMLVVAVAAVHPALLNAGLRLVPRALHRQVLVWSGSWARGLWLLTLSVVSWIVYGVAFSLFVAALAPISMAAVLPLTAVNALSFTAGYVALLAPGGIGVRESAMTVLLAPLLPLGVAAVLAIAARLWSIAAELLLAGAGLLAGRHVN
jgi:uncharacterized membrane protein YbhN (UPF0104 family)